MNAPVQSTAYINSKQYNGDRVILKVFIWKLFPSYADRVRGALFTVIDEEPSMSSNKKVEDSTIPQFVFAVRFVEDLGQLDQIWRFEWVERCDKDVDVYVYMECDNDDDNLSEQTNLQRASSDISHYDNTFAASFNAYFQFEFHYTK